VPPPRPVTQPRAVHPDAKPKPVVHPPMPAKATPDQMNDLDIPTFIRRQMD
jgi:hypothetical protein